MTGAMRISRIEPVAPGTAPFTISVRFLGIHSHHFQIFDGYRSAAHVARPMRRPGHTRWGAVEPMEPGARKRFFWPWVLGPPPKL